MSQAEAPGALVAAVERELGPVEILIANAGINDPLEQDPRNIDAATWDHVMAINLRARRIPVGRLGRVEEVADLISAIVRNPYLTNQSILLDGGIRPT